MDGNIFTTGSSDLTFRVWDIRQKRACFRIFDKNTEGTGISAIKFMPENVNTIAVGYEDGTVKIWDLRCTESIGKLKEKKAVYDGIKSLQFSKSGRLLFSAHNSNYVKIWDLLTEDTVGQCVSEGFKAKRLDENKKEKEEFV